MYVSSFCVEIERDDVQKLFSGNKFRVDDFRKNEQLANISSTGTFIQCD